MAAEIGLECHIEDLDVNLADIVAHPLLEDIHEELAILLAPDRALRYQITFLRVEQALAIRLLTPAQVGDVDRLFGGALDDGNELHPLCAHLIAEETIDRAAVLLVGGVDRAQYVEFDSVLAQVPPALHHLVEGALFAAVEPVRVVDLAWAVNAQANQEIVFLEEAAPLIVEEDAVGLKGMLHDLLGAAVLFDELDGASEEVDLHQRRFASLPRDSYCGRAVRLQQLLDVSLERGLGHPILFVRIQRFFGQEEAIGAIDVANGPARLRQKVEARWCVVWPGIVSQRSHFRTILVTAARSAAATPGCLCKRQTRPGSCNA